jgi:hypothetical protein
MARRIDGNHSGRRHMQNFADGSRGLVASAKLSEVLEHDPEGLAGKVLKRYEDTHRQQCQARYAQNIASNVNVGVHDALLRR